MDGRGRLCFCRPAALMVHIGSNTAACGRRGQRARCPVELLQPHRPLRHPPSLPKFMPCGCLAWQGDQQVLAAGAAAAAAAGGPGRRRLRRRGGGGLSCHQGTCSGPCTTCVRATHRQPSQAKSARPIPLHPIPLHAIPPSHTTPFVVAVAAHPAGWHHTCVQKHAATRCLTLTLHSTAPHILGQGQGSCRFYEHV